MGANSSTTAASRSDNLHDLEALIEECKKDVDRGLLRANLRLTVEERLRQLQSYIESMQELRRAIKAAKRRK